MHQLCNHYKSIMHQLCINYASIMRQLCKIMHQLCNNYTTIIQELAMISCFSWYRLCNIIVCLLPIAKFRFEIKNKKDKTKAKKDTRDNIQEIEWDNLTWCLDSKCHSWSRIPQVKESPAQYICNFKSRIILSLNLHLYLCSSWIEGNTQCIRTAFIVDKQRKNSFILERTLLFYYWQFHVYPSDHSQATLRIEERHETVSGSQVFSLFIYYYLWNKK